LELASHLAGEHGAEQHVGAPVFAKNIVGGQEVEDLAGGDPAVHVHAERIRAILLVGRPRASGWR